MEFHIKDGWKTTQNTGANPAITPSQPHRRMGREEKKVPQKLLTALFLSPRTFFFSLCAWLEMEKCKHSTPPLLFLNGGWVVTVLLPAFLSSFSSLLSFFYSVSCKNLPLADLNDETWEAPRFSHKTYMIGFRGSRSSN